MKKNKNSNRLNGTLIAVALLPILALVVNACQTSKKESVHHAQPDLVTLTKVKTPDPDDVRIADRYLPSEIKFEHSLSPTADISTFDFAVTWSFKVPIETWSIESKLDWEFDLVELSPDKVGTPSDLGKLPTYPDMYSNYGARLSKGKRYRLRIAVRLIAEHVIGKRWVAEYEIDLTSFKESK